MLSSREAHYGRATERLREWNPEVSSGDFLHRIIRISGTSASATENGKRRACEHCRFYHRSFSEHNSSPRSYEIIVQQDESHKSL